MLLRNKDKEKLRAIFSGINLDFEVWAYGSRVSGEAHDGSDLDLVIRNHNLQKMPIDIYLDLKNQIQKSTIPIVVELFDWARLPESFQKNIEELHEVFYISQKAKLNEPEPEYKKSPEP
jgi:predicted nucleotidyltransferase